MALIHTLTALAEGGLYAMQATQRDWSPFLVHFTSYDAMADVREAVRNNATPGQVSKQLASADARSFDIVRIIRETGRLAAHKLSDKEQVPPCVSLSECTLPGLIALCERFGRFGFVFEKSRIYALGGRPCLYIDREAYAHLVKTVDQTPAGPTLLGLANVYSPPGFGQVQDYTHEREWRLFSDLPLLDVPPDFFICPSEYIRGMRKLFGTEPTYVPIDTMFTWGA